MNMGWMCASLLAIMFAARLEESIPRAVILLVSSASVCWWACMVRVPKGECWITHESTAAVLPMRVIPEGWHFVSPFSGTSVSDFFRVRTGKRMVHLAFDVHLKCGKTLRFFATWYVEVEFLRASHSQAAAFCHFFSQWKSLSPPKVFDLTGKQLSEIVYLEFLELLEFCGGSVTPEEAPRLLCQIFTAASRRASLQTGLLMTLATVPLIEQVVAD